MVTVAEIDQGDISRDVAGAGPMSNIGTWMQGAAAGWLMTGLNADAFVVSLFQVAASLPMFLFALPAGALADIIDRRRLLIAIQVAVTVLAVSVIPNPPPQETLSTILLACRALMGVAVGANELVGFTSASVTLGAAGRVAIARRNLPLEGL
jgi:MFS family permease